MALCFFTKVFICIKSIFKTLKISYYSGKDKVCLRGGTGFESCPMQINKYFTILFIYLYVLKIRYIIFSFSRSVRITLRQRNIGHLWRSRYDSCHPKNYTNLCNFSRIEIQKIFHDPQNEIFVSMQKVFWWDSSKVHYLSILSKIV